MLFISSKAPKSTQMALKKNATNNHVVNQPTATSARANPTIYLAVFTSVDVPSHPYDTKRKFQTFVQLYGQTLPVLINPLYVSKEVFVAQTSSTSGSSVGGQLLKEQEDYASRNFVPSSPR